MKNGLSTVEKDLYEVIFLWPVRLCKYRSSKSTLLGRVEVVISIALGLTRTVFGGVSRRTALLGENQRMPSVFQSTPVVLPFREPL